MTAESIILTILTIFLLAFLVVAIVAGFYIIKLMRNLKKISDQAAGAGQNIFKISKTLKENITPVAVAAAVLQFVKNLKNKVK